MTLFLPQVHLKVGDENMTPVPPQHLLEFQYTSKLGEFYEIEASFVDPWEMYYQPGYRPLEDRILQAQVDVTTGDVLNTAEQISFQIGLIEENGTSRKSYWGPELNTALNNFSPSFTDAGMELSITAFCWQLAEIAHRGRNSGLKLRGKRSDVVKQIAEEYGFKHTIEETNDDKNRKVAASRDVVDGSTVFRPRVWAIGAMTIPQFIRQKLLPRAASKSDGTTPFEFQFLPGNEIIFAPPLSKKWREKQKDVPEFTYLFSKQDVVKSYSPDFQSDMIGAWGRGGDLVRTYNPATKSMVTTQRTADNSKTHGSFAPANQVKKRPDNRGVVTGGTVDPDATTIENESRRNWNILNDSLFNASITLVGNKETMKLIAGDLMRVNVILPTGKSHWSSGLWMVTEAVHTISSEYTITCQLQRDTAFIGNQASSEQAQWEGLDAILENG